MRRLLRKIKQHQQGITGLETAIILIAFVIVASVFAYVVLSAGLFSTQKAKEAIYAGLEEAKATVEIKGNIYGKMENSVLTEVYFTVGTTTGGGAIDFTDTSSANSSNLVIISYVDAYQIFPTIDWTMTKLNTTDADNMLDETELFQITVDLSVEWGAYNIRVNAVAPTWVADTRISNPLMDLPGFKEHELGKIPLGRFATFDDVANSVCFLASDASTITTGSILPVDGGWTTQ